MGGGGGGATILAALGGRLTHAPTVTEPVFGLAVPSSIRDVPSALLSPRSTWADPAAYDAQAKKLAGMFRTNFEKFGSVDDKVKGAGPKG